MELPFGKVHLYNQIFRFHFMDFIRNVCVFVCVAIKMQTKFFRVNCDASRFLSLVQNHFIQFKVCTIHTAKFGCALHSLLGFVSIRRNSMDLSGCHLSVPFILAYFFFHCLFVCSRHSFSRCAIVMSFCYPFRLLWSHRGNQIQARIL